MADDKRAQAIEEIRQMEMAFNELLAEKGRAVAFSHYAAEDGVLSRGGEIIKGKKGIYEFYAKSTSKDVKLTWKPDFIDVSDDLTMGYTYGQYEYSGTRENGETFSSTGIFHTVWKKQADGSWRYVYD